MFYFWERQSTSRGGADRERKTQNQKKQAPSSELSAQSPMWGSNSWTEPKSDAQPTEPPGTPVFFKRLNILWRDSMARAKYIGPTIQVLQIEFQFFRWLCDLEIVEFLKALIYESINWGQTRWSFRFFELSIFVVDPVRLSNCYEV